MRRGDDSKDIHNPEDHPARSRQAENAIGPFAVGQKELAICRLALGCSIKRDLDSLVETAKANGLEPYRYLRFLFEGLPYAVTPEDYRRLTPQHLDRNESDAAFPRWSH